MPYHTQPLSQSDFSLVGWQGRGAQEQVGTWNCTAFQDIYNFFTYSILPYRRKPSFLSSHSSNSHKEVCLVLWCLLISIFYPKSLKPSSSLEIKCLLLPHFLSYLGMKQLLFSLWCCYAHDYWTFLPLFFSLFLWYQLIQMDQMRSNR